jgi:hypothetical protein
MAFKMSQVRWIVGIISGLLVGANAGVQLWHQLDLELPRDSRKPPAIEQVQQLKSDIEIDKP